MKHGLKYLWILFTAAMLTGLYGGNPEPAVPEENVDRAEEFLLSERDDSHLLFEYAGDLFLSGPQGAEYDYGRRRPQSERTVVPANRKTDRTAAWLLPDSVSGKKTVPGSFIPLFTDLSLQYVFRLRRILI